MAIARTEAASGGKALLDEILAFSSSLALDRSLIREDLVGSLAHLRMLVECGLVPRDDARRLHAGLVELFEEAVQGRLELPPEEDVHMAVEAELFRRVGEAAGRLHTARSRNDQVALDLRLHVREQIVAVFRGLAELLSYLAERAEKDGEILLPAYTHRQRAQPVSLAYWLAAYGAMFARDVDAFRFAYDQADRLPLGVGAIAGTTLPIDRELTRRLLRFTDLTENGLDTVGDRDFALDFAYATARFLLHAGRLSADLVDYASAEFGFVRLDGEIACGSSLMPQKRNPDVFELVRGKSARGIGNLVTLLSLVKGLPGGYQRDLQEDRLPLLETGPLARSVLEVLRIALPHVRFDAEACARALHVDYTQATDLAEALVKKGIPFREAYMKVGALVRAAQERKIPLAEVNLALARTIDPRFDEEVLEAAQLSTCIERKLSRGSTGPISVAHQIEALWDAAQRAREEAERLPTLDGLFASLEEFAP
ncbi:MAG TPA: argininosuccinate lyase [Fredinandcohnia sp.]|nr:argininosuccinate lyase [Fredinandcohnia sp.]